VTAVRGWFGLSCWNALSTEQQDRLIEHGGLPLGSLAEGDSCTSGASVAIERQDDTAPGPRFYCRPCAVQYLGGRS